MSSMFNVQIFSDTSRRRGFFDENSRWKRTWTLRETKTTRLVFRADLIDDNSKDPEANVRGTFAFQKKGSKGQWGDPETINLSTLKSGEGVKLELKSGELRTLYKELRQRYGDEDAVDVGRALSTLGGADVQPLKAALAKMDAGAKAVIVKVVGWLAQSEKPQELAKQLGALGPDCLESLQAAARLSRLLEVKHEWDQNNSNASEEYWQKMLSERPFLLQQIFDFPITVFAGKAYVGGKTLYDAEGKLADFLLKNPVTHNLSIIELKTPVSKLLGREYRTGVYPLSRELMGSVTQSLTYRDSLQNEFFSLAYKTGDDFKVFDPCCVVIVGDVGAQLDTPEKIRSFDLARAQLKDVRVLTFDELYARLTNLIDLLSRPN